MADRIIFGKLTGSTLKIIALLTMLTDHIAAFLIHYDRYPAVYYVMRNIGRISFPIFCFLIVEGYFHTSDIKKYMLRLAAFGIISEMPFDLALTGLNNKSILHQNVFFTLLLGLAVVWFIDNNKNNVIIHCLAIWVGCVAAVLFKTDYSCFGVIQIIMFYYFRNVRLYRIAGIILLNMFMGQPAGAASLLFIENYNGKRGLKLKYLMYAFYPVHLLIIGIAAEIMRR
ncbi:MAG: conjugal transfer protein TraX [Lachnospiraceae bacterium]|nr:conjugal transfer protein TraX [Lachnospiraceae bacterium]